MTSKKPDSKSKLMPVAKETLMGIESPVKSSGAHRRPPSDPPSTDHETPSEGDIDKAKLRQAWNSNMAMSKAMIEQMELTVEDNAKTRRDNFITRAVSGGSTAVVLLVCGTLIWMMAGLEAVIEAGAVRLSNVESTIGLVADSVVRTNEAAAAEAEAVTVGASSVPVDETALPPAPVPAVDDELQRAAAEARMGAQASALKAQAQIAEKRGSEAVGKVRRKATKLQRRAAEQMLADPFHDIGEIEPDASVKRSRTF